MDGADGFNTYEKNTPMKRTCCECENDATKTTDGGMAGLLHWCSDCFEAGDMDIYSIVKDMKVGDLTGTYYQTYGGGPEGGFLVTAEGHFYELDRTWHQPWKVTKRTHLCVLFRYTDGVPTSVRVSDIS